MKTTKIALVCNFKDEIKNAAEVLACVAPVIDEFIVVDSGSTDGTPDECRRLGAHVYDIPDVFDYEDVSGLWNPGRHLSGYGDLRTLDKWLARKHDCEWVLIIDGDERMLRMDAAKLGQMKGFPYDFIWLPRQHYRAFDMTICENPNIEVHPDFQPRFFRTLPEIYFERRVHEIPCNKGRELASLHAPVIRHFGWMKTDKRKQMIVDMCNKLWAMEQDPNQKLTYKKWDASLGRTADDAAEQMAPTGVE